MKSAFLSILCILAAMLPLCSCGREGLQEDVPAGDFCDLSVVLDASCFGDGTRSHWVSDESADSGYQLIVYNRTHGIIEDCLYSASRNDGLGVALRRSDDYVLLVLGNYWFIDRGTGERKGFGEILSATRFDYEDFFDAAGLFGCRIFPDVRTVVGNAALRYETFDDLCTLGIPYSGFCEVHPFSAPVGEPLVLDRIRHLFARISVCIDHSGLDGGIDQDYFTNTALCMRNVPTLMASFLKSGDISPFVPDGNHVADTGDYEIFETNGSIEKYCFYVPENNQGSVPSLTADTRVPGNAPEWASYVEFKGMVNPDAGGYGGKVTYRFYPGLDNMGNFQLPRGSDIRIHLSFKASSVYGSRLDPTWRVETEDDFVDRRLLALDTVGDGRASDFVGNSSCPSSVVALRRNMPRSIALYYNRRGDEGHNDILSADVIRQWSDDFEPANLQESAVRLIPDTDHGEAGDYSRNGISASVDMDSGRLELSVSDPARFVEGRDYLMYMELYPGRKLFPVTIRTCPDLSVSFNSSGFYVGMKRNVALSGFCGNASVSVSPASASDVLKTAASDDVRDYVTAAPRSVEGDLNLYAFRNCSGVTLSVKSDDVFNDGESGIVRTFSVLKPSLALSSSSCFVPVDGTDVPLLARYMTGTSGILIPEQAFDADAYAMLLKPQMILTNEGRTYNEDGSPMSVDVTSCVGIGDESVYCCGFHPSRSTSEIVLGKVYARAANLSLDIASPHVAVKTAFPRWKDPVEQFTGVGTDYYDYFRVPGDASDVTLPSISSTSVGIYLQGCSGSAIRPVSSPDSHGLYRKGRCEVTESASRNGMSTVKWSFSPSSYSSFDVLYAPYGRQNIQASFTNSYSGETFTLESKYCMVSHEADLKMMLSAYNGSHDGYIEIGTGLMHYLWYVSRRFDISTGSLSLGYGISPSYSYCVPDQNTGEYPTNYLGERVSYRGSSIYVRAGFFSYGGQYGDWSDWDNSTFFDANLCSEIMNSWNYGHSGSWYGNPDPVYFYDNDINDRAMQIPSRYYPSDGYANLSSYFTVYADGHPEYVWYYLR